MEHHFTKTDDDSLRGGWLEDDGHLFCRWFWDPEAMTLQVTRGHVGREQHLDVNPESLPTGEELGQRMAELALEIAREINPNVSQQ